jgi:hypothetical protein
MKHTLTLAALAQSSAFAFVAAITIVAMLSMVFLVIEPKVSRGQVDVSNSFFIRQTITAESSFTAEPTNVTMVGPINGVTGGNATGTSQFTVRSSNANGYYVEIDFEDNGTPEAMLGDRDLSQAIRDYGGDVAGQPSLNWTASTAAQFGYKVLSSTTADTAQSFRDNGSSCNQAAGSQTADRCWKSPSTTPFEIVRRTGPAVTGATSTIQFKVHVPNGATPVPTAQTYTATATLSLFII